MRDRHVILYRVGRKKIAIGFPTGLLRKDAEALVSLIKRFKPEAKDITIYKKDDKFKIYDPSNHQT